MHTQLTKKCIPILLALILPGAALGQSDWCNPLSLENNRPSVAVTIQGNEYPAFLTTSNLGSTISQKLVDDLGLRERVDANTRIVSAFGEPTTRRYVSDVELTLFNDTINADEMTIVSGEAAQLSLSLRVFEELVIQLNFPKSEICFYPREVVKLQETQNIDFDNDPEIGSPVIRVTLNGDFETWLRFNPSYSGGLLVDPFVANELDLFSKAEARPDSDDSDSLSAIVSELAFGPYVLGDVPIEFPKAGVRDNLTTRRTTQTGTNIRSSQGSHGSIGFDVLRHFVITFDLKLERMHIVAN